MLAKEKDVENEVKSIVDIILETVPALEIYLFGSFVDGTAKEDSDYDFYVVIPDGSMRELEATWDIQGSIKSRTRGIDMLVRTKSKFDRNKNTLGYIEGEVVRKGLKLYG
ncbi:MAG: nucleotidyltransferase domain-containing protein [Oscillospiraceae bacterium]|nr:nucleotidyltransferase domain-containing protein [Oscillospiraceae bacterium]MCL2278162.1 nucleotidyltransferase domain-containing protein [Oscillospiraceae bacterium]